MASRKPPEMTDEDLTLWQKVAQTVERAMGKEIPQVKPVKMPKVKKASGDVMRSAVVMPRANKKAPQGTSLDRRTEQRLRQGKITIDETIDLHGMTQDSAHNLLNARLVRAHKQGKRLVLVITGKGLRSAEPGGVLKKAIGTWCEMPPLSSIILKRVKAQPRHGGGGAFYIYLRRQK